MNLTEIKRIIKENDEQLCPRNQIMQVQQTKFYKDRNLPKLTKEDRKAEEIYNKRLTQ